MKLLDLTCPHCGAAMQLNAQSKQMYCSYCGALLMIDDEVQHIQYDNAEKAGYEFEKGRQRAQAEAEMKKPSATAGTGVKKKRRTGLWVLGWIFIFPVPLTVLMVRNRKISTVLKIAIIAAAWIAYFLMAVLFGNDSGAAAVSGEAAHPVIQTTAEAQQSAGEEAFF